MKKLIIISLAFISICQTEAQEVWDLRSCIEYAWENSIEAQEAQVNTEFSELGIREAKEARYPNLNGSVSYGLQLGRSIDPVTNDFESTAFSSNGLSLNGGMLVYNAGSVRNRIKQSNVDFQISELDEQAAKNNVAVLITNAYLNILLTKENLRNARTNEQTTKSQLENSLKLIKAGSLAEAERYAIDAQLARDAQNIVVLENGLDVNLLNLKQLMRLDLNKEIDVEAPIIEDITPFIQAENLASVYAKSKSFLPEIKASDLRINSAKLNEEIVNASAFPSLTFGYGLGTNWSSLAKEFDGTFDVERTNQIFYADALEPFLGTDEIVLGIDQLSPNLKNVAYFDQLTNNFNYGISLNASIPIYQRSLVRINNERAKLNSQLAALSADRVHQNVKTNIQTALTNLRSGIKSYEAAEQTLIAQQKALENTERLFELGRANSLDLLTTKNLYLASQAEVVAAKYELVFRSKILDFYQGKPLDLKTN